MASLRKQLRAQQAQTTTARGREVELRLTNEGLMEEITRWKRQAHQEATAAQEQQAQQAQQEQQAQQAQQVQQLFDGMDGAQQAELLQALQAAHTASHPDRAPAAASATGELLG